MKPKIFENKTKELIDNLKGICANYGLGNDGNEFKIITQSFLYKFINDKFLNEIKKLDKNLKNDQNLEKKISEITSKEYELLLLRLPPNSVKLYKEHFLGTLYNEQNSNNFAKIFDDTFRSISILNNDIFSVKTNTGSKVILFDELSTFISDTSQRDDFCRALVNQLVNFNFETFFELTFDFYSVIFEYLIQDYNKDGGDKYAEYYTPYSISKIMAEILVAEKTSNVSCYDPAAGSGTLLMNLAQKIGTEKCSIYSQDISQKSSSMLRLNLILNNLVHSIQNIVKGNTLLDPYHKENNKIRKFDYIVSNPPFKVDFSSYRNELDTKENAERFFAGVPNITKKDKSQMSIYPLFLQHLLFSLSKKGLAAVVVPTGFISDTKKIFQKIKKKIVDEKILKAVVSMPGNIFANTPTNITILFLDKNLTDDKIVLIDASKKGFSENSGKKKRTYLSKDDEKLIIDTVKKQQTINKFSIIVSTKQIQEEEYSLSAIQYFDQKINFIEMTHEEFKIQVNNEKSKLSKNFEESEIVKKSINEILNKFDEQL